jgi:hypothetical protein
MNDPLLLLLYSSVLLAAVCLLLSYFQDIQVIHRDTVAIIIALSSVTITTITAGKVNRDYYYQVGPMADPNHPTDIKVCLYTRCFWYLNCCLA